MSNEPKVSIIIPAYNAADYLADAIDSALAQTYKNIEILVINDGSKDDGATEKVALSYGDKIRYFKKENGGVSTALNLGIEKMEGDYFSWLSHDDIYLPQKIEKQVSLIETEKDIILCSGSLMDSEKKPIPHRTKTVEKALNGRELFGEFLHGYALNGLGFLIPRKVFEKVGMFDETMRYLQDLDLWLRMMWYDFRFVCHKDMLVVSRVHKNQTTNLMNDIFDVDREFLAKKHLNEISKALNKETEIVFLKQYYALFVKGDNTAGTNLTEQRLKELNYGIFGFKIKALPYKIICVVKKIKRAVYNAVFRLNGIRG